MKTLNDNPENNTTAKKVKKVWNTPEIYLLDTDEIRGGANTGVHEGTVTRTAPGAAKGNNNAGALVLYQGTPSHFHFALYTKNHYNS